MGETDERFWERHVFVLLSPDALHRGLQGRMAERLAAEGFRPAAARLVRADPEMIDDLYADVIAGQWQTWRYRLVDALFSSGPSLALLCRGADRHADPHRALAERKGHQHPHRAAPGTIRADFGAVNSVLGLMHSSDGPQESAREAGVFGLSPADAGGADASYLCGLGGGGAEERRGFDDVLAGVRTRALLALWEDLPAGVRTRAGAAFPDRAALGRPGAGDALADLVAGHVRGPLAEVLRCEFTPDWLERVRMRTVLEELERIGVRPDAWEHLVLETSLYFPPARGRGAVEAEAAA